MASAPDRAEGFLCVYLKQSLLRFPLNHAFPCMMIFYFFFPFCETVLNRKSLYQAGQVSCSPVNVPNCLQNASTFVCVVNFTANTCFLKALYTLLAPVIYCLSTFFHFIFCTLNVQIQINVQNSITLLFRSSSDFSYPIFFLNARKGI